MEIGMDVWWRGKVDGHYVGRGDEIGVAGVMVWDTMQEETLEATVGCEGYRKSRWKRRWV